MIRHKEVIYIQLCLLNKSLIYLLTGSLNHWHTHFTFAVILVSRRVEATIPLVQVLM